MTDKFPRVFLARAGKDGEDEDYVLEHGLAVIGFTGYGSLEHAKDYDDVYKLVAAADPDANPHMVGNYAGQLWAFAISMREGDTVALPRKLTSQVALGTVVGPYKYQRIDGVLRHTRPVKWIRPDVPRSVFKQDLLASFGAAMTVCNITRHDAARRVATVLAGGSDPGQADTVPGETPPKPEGPVEPPEPPVDLTQLAHDQIVEHIQAHFRGHDLARLVDAVLNAEGWTTKVSPPGPDGGVDILAGRGSLGLDQPRLCVQVKSQVSPADVTVLRTLQGSMQTFSASQGLLVCWGGYNRVVLQEARQSHFSVRLWESKDLVEAIYRTYEKLPAEIQAELPLKRVWMLVKEEEDE